MSRLPRDAPDRPSHPALVARADFRRDRRGRRAVRGRARRPRHDLDDDILRAPRRHRTRLVRAVSRGARARGRRPLEWSGPDAGHTLTIDETSLRALASDPRVAVTFTREGDFPSIPTRTNAPVSEARTSSPSSTSSSRRSSSARPPTPSRDSTPTRTRTLIPCHPPSPVSEPPSSPVSGVASSRPRRRPRRRVPASVHPRGTRSLARTLRGDDRGGRASPDAPATWRQIDESCEPSPRISDGPGFPR